MSHFCMLQKKVIQRGIGFNSILQECTGMKRLFLCFFQHYGSVRIRGAGDREIRPRVLQRHLALHHVRRASVRGPHPETLHRHLPRARDGRAGAGGRSLRQTHLPLPVTRDYDQMDQREDQMSLLREREIPGRVHITSALVRL